MQTHETYIAAVAALGIGRLPEAQRDAFRGMKLTYGVGPDGIRGVTYYKGWKGDGTDQPTALVSLNPLCQADWVQVAGTTLHELGHVLAGMGTGHGPAWHDACEALGLRRILAAGTVYRLSMFAPDIRMVLAEMEKPADGSPVCGLPGMGGHGAPILRIRPCTAGIGTRGGKSRLAGSSNRQRLYECEGDPAIGHKPQKVRVASDTFAAHCDHCRTAFRLGGYR